MNAAKVTGYAKKPKKELIKAIDDCVSLSQLFALIQHENITMQMHSQPGASNLAPKVLSAQEIIDKKDTPLERLKTEIKKSVFENNDRQADLLREELKRNHTFLLNLMSSPGSGKTTTLMATINALKDDLRIGVMEADIDSDVDAATISTSGAKVIQLHTGGMCHLDAGMTEQGLRELGAADLDLAILENVGNLVCPAEFDTGAVKNVAILSVPEGHDKPLKYPLMFEVCQALIINKIDVLPYFDFNMDKVREFAHKRNPDIEIFPISAKTGEGVDAWCNWLEAQVRAWNE